MQNIKLPLVAASIVIISASAGAYYYFSSGRPPEIQAANIQASGDTENAAIEEAKRSAIAKICGETILGSSRSQTESQKTTKLSTSGENSKSFNSDSKNADENLSLVGGSIKSYTVKNQRQEGGRYYVEIEANVTDCKKSDAVTDALTGGDKGGLISNPKNLAEKYSNARSLAQRGESDRALKIYEQLLDEKIIYADPISDMVLLAKKVYGSSGAKDYIQKSFSRIKNRPEYYFALEQVSNQPVDGAWNIILQNTDSFPPLIDAYLNNHEKYCVEKYPPQNDRENNFGKCREEILKLEKIDSVISSLDAKKKSGEYNNFFLDPYKAKDYSENMWSTMYLQSMRNMQANQVNVAAKMKEIEPALKRANEIKKQQDEQQADMKKKYPNLYKN
jgi:hypothetical protein